jgi:hypothetical protein
MQREKTNGHRGEMVSTSIQNTNEDGYEEADGMA